MTESENRPHVVHQKDRVLGAVEMFPTYAAAFDYWRQVHHFDRPYVVHTVGRECTVAAEVVDVAE